MRVLFVVPQLPHLYGGGGVRMYYQIKYLSKMGINVDLIGYHSDVETDISRYVRHLYSIECEKRSLLSRAFTTYPLYKGFADKLKDILSKEDYDLIHIHKFQMTGYVSSLNIPVVVDLWASGLKGIWSLFLYERSIVNKARILYQMGKYFLNDQKNYRRFKYFFVVSKEAKDYIDKRYPNKNVFIVPSGVESVLEDKRENNTRGLKIAFCGDMSFFPNIDAVLYFYRKVYIRVKKELKDVSFIIIGRNPDNRILEIAAEDKSVVVTGFVADVREYLKVSDIFVSPLRTGLGIRNKILEAMACGLCVLGTPNSFEGIDIEDKKNVLVCRDADDFYRNIIFLDRNRGFIKKIGDEARRLIKERYLWSEIVRKMVDCYYEILKDWKSKNSKGWALD